MSKLEITICETSAEFAHQFGPLMYQGSRWDLTHLDPFAFQCDLDLGFPTTVLVLFSCHCFTDSFAWDPRPRAEIPHCEIYDDEREARVLCPDRYQSSRRLLRDLVLALPVRRIIVADERQPNFMTVETTNAFGEPSLYAVFFEVEKDKTRKHPSITPHTIGLYVRPRSDETPKRGQEGRVTEHPASGRGRSKDSPLAQNDQRLPFGSRRMRDSLFTFR
jgi:hypothetical protein